MPDKEETIKKVFEEKVNCPYCDKRIIVKKERRIKAAAIPADIDEAVYAEKDDQTKITEHEKKAGIKKK